MKKNFLAVLLVAVLVISTLTVLTVLPSFADTDDAVSENLVTVESSSSEAGDDAVDNSESVDLTATDSDNVSDAALATDGGNETASSGDNTEIVAGEPEVADEEIAEATEDTSYFSSTSDYIAIAVAVVILVVAVVVIVILAPKKNGSKKK